MHAHLCLDSYEPAAMWTANLFHNSHVDGKPLPQTAATFPHFMPAPSYTAWLID